MTNSAEGHRDLHGEQRIPYWNTGFCAAEKQLVALRFILSLFCFMLRNQPALMSRFLRGNRASFFFLSCTKTEKIVENDRQSHIKRARSLSSWLAPHIQIFDTTLRVVCWQPLSRATDSSLCTLSPGSVCPKRLNSRGPVITATLHRGQPFSPGTLANAYKLWLL